MKGFGKNTGKTNALSLQQVHFYRSSLKKIKSPVHSISKAQYLAQRIQTIPLHLQPILKIMLGKLNTYRRVREDGNYFFRVLALTYLSKFKSNAFQINFSFINEISLTECSEQSIPKQFKEFYQDKILKNVLKTYWETDYQYFIEKAKRNYKLALALMFNENPYLDFIIILYFRSVCLLRLQRKKQELKQFLRGTEEAQIQTYGQDSTSIIFNIFHIFFQVNIEIYEVLNDDVKRYGCSDEGKNLTRKTISFLYENGHYDLLDESSIHFIEEIDQKQPQYYSKINQNKVRDRCLECLENRQVFVDHRICQECYNKNLDNLQTFNSLPKKIQYKSSKNLHVFFKKSPIVRSKKNKTQSIQNRLAKAKLSNLPFKAENFTKMLKQKETKESEIDKFEKQERARKDEQKRQLRELKQSWTMPQDECIICYNHRREVIGECFHISICFKCSQKVHECPVCKKTTKWNRIYYP